jgi:hypothetical protein
LAKEKADKEAADKLAAEREAADKKAADDLAKIKEPRQNDTEYGKKEFWSRLNSEGEMRNQNFVLLRLSSQIFEDLPHFTLYSSDFPHGFLKI